MRAARAGDRADPPSRCAPGGVHALVRPRRGVRHSWAPAPAARKAGYCWECEHPTAKAPATTSREPQATGGSGGSLPRADTSRPERRPMANAEKVAAVAELAE